MNILKSVKETLVGKNPKQQAGELAAEIEKEVADMKPNDAIVFLMELDNKLYNLQGRTAIRYGNGVHTKHKHINYHKFFLDNISKGESVLDIGTGKGELAADMAAAVKPGKVVGIEIEPVIWELAQGNHQADNLEFVLGDATKDDVLPDAKFDVVTLSNVLEHIEYRPELLSKLASKYQPKKVLIRVPLFERDWRVPLKKELGVDYRLDDTHFIEYTRETFLGEMEKAGLEIIEMQVRWGEIWCVLKPKK